MRIWTGTDNLHMSARLECKRRRMPGRGIELRRWGGAWKHEDYMHACKAAKIWQCSRRVVNCLECSTHKRTTWKRRIAFKRTAHVQLAQESKHCETSSAQSIRRTAQGESVHFLVRCIIDLLRKDVLYFASLLFPTRVAAIMKDESTCTNCTTSMILSPAATLTVSMLWAFVVNVALRRLTSLPPLGNPDDAIRHVLLGISNYFLHTQRQSQPPQHVTVIPYSRNLQPKDTIYCKMKAYWFDNLPVSV